MRLSKVEICNFRSIRHASLTVRDLTTLIGSNGAGKSNIFRAIQRAFTFTPSAASGEDVYAFVNDGDECWIECEFKDLTGDNITQLAAYVMPGGLVRIRTTIYHDGKVYKNKKQGYIAEPKEAWLREGFDKYSDKAFWKELGIDPLSYVDGGGGRITRAVHGEFCEKYIEKEADSVEYVVRLSDTEIRGRQSSLAQCLPEFTYIPATGEVADAVVGKSSSLLNRIAKGLLESAADDESYKAAEKAIEAACELVNPSGRRLPAFSVLESEICTKLSSWGDINCNIRVDTPDLASVLVEGLTIDIGIDGHHVGLRDQGDGVQRQVLFQVFRLYADYAMKRGAFSGRGSSEGSERRHIIVLEEPEIFLHPQAQERFLDDLVDISAQDQVLMSTHSNHLLDIHKSDGLVIVQMSRGEKSAKETVLRSASEEWVGMGAERVGLKEYSFINRDVSKMYFARKVVLVEGVSDLHYLVGTARCHANCFDHEVAVVPVGSKENIPRFLRALHAFGLPALAVYDKDPGNQNSGRTTSLIISEVRKARAGGIGSGILELDPDLPVVAGNTNEGTSNKVIAAIKFMDEQTPAVDFQAIVEQVYDREWFSHSP